MGVNALQTESVKRAKLRLVAFLITWAVLAASRAVTGATMAQGVVAPTQPIPMPLSPDPAALPEWAAESAKELVAAGLVSVSAESPAAPTRGDFMALAVACAGRSTDGWVRSLRRESVIVGRPDGSLHLDDPITRGEATAFLIKLLQVEPEGSALGLHLKDGLPSGPAPADIAGHWSATYFLDALRWGLVRSPPDGLLRPDARVSTAEALTLAGRFLHAGEGLMPLQTDLPQNAALVRTAEAHVRAFTDVFSREPYDFAPLLATCTGQAHSLIAQNSRYYLGRYSLGTRFKFELLSFSGQVTARSLFLATVTTREKMREYVDGKAEESEYEDRLDLRRVNGSWLIYR